ncbi:hypothetical protein NC651_013867 [Populus alba x Populus x berolinensis]|nr:hypothetical protein NC651_013867 [Populus alba x Populus x berolinensis]
MRIVTRDVCAAASGASIAVYNSRFWIGRWPRRKLEWCVGNKMERQKWMTVKIQWLRLLASLRSYIPGYLPRLKKNL